MRIKSFAILFAFAFMFFSCGKDTLPENLQEGFLLKQLFIEGELYAEFNYNDAGLITEEKSKFHYTKHSYNSRNQLIQSEHYCMN